MAADVVDRAAQVADAARALLALAHRRPYNGQLRDIRAVAQQLMDLANAHEREGNAGGR